LHKAVDPWNLAGVMDEDHQDQTLLVKCPSCSQRFRVGEDLRERMVECGACDHRFRINEEVIVRARKFYPGEQKDPRLSRFQRVPMAPVAGLELTNQVNYAPAPAPEAFEPVSPLRIILGVIGVAMIVITALFLIFGASRGGVFDGVTTDKRLMLACFVAVLGLALLLYANPRSRTKALLIGLLMTGGLVSLPFFFREGSAPLQSGITGDGTGAPSQAAALPEPQNVDDLRNQIGTKPLDEEIERLVTEGSGKTAVGIWLRGLNGENRYPIRDYIERVCKSSVPPHPFPRGEGSYLMVVTGVTMDLDAIAALCGRFGAVEAIHRDLAVIEVKVNNEYFSESPIEVLLDRDNPDFYKLNQKELESLDMERVKRAVNRLADSEPKVFRTDISRHLTSLLREEHVDFKGEVARALAVWVEDPKQVGADALRAAEELKLRGQPVPKDLVELAITAKTPGVIPLVDELWRKDPMAWEDSYGRLGTDAESVLRLGFPELEGLVRQSAVRLFAKVGTLQSVDLLERAISSADAELKVNIENALTAIRKRGGS